MIRRGLKYNWKGDTISICTARVVMTQAVVYMRVTGGISPPALAVCSGHQGPKEGLDTAAATAAALSPAPPK